MNMTVGSGHEYDGRHGSIHGHVLTKNALARAIGSLLFEVEPGDWRSLLTAVIVLSAVAAGVAWVLARRAGRVDPLVALRSE